MVEFFFCLAGWLDKIRKTITMIISKARKTVLFIFRAKFILLLNCSGWPNKSLVPFLVLRELQKMPFPYLIALFISLYIWISHI